MTTIAMAAGMLPSAYGVGDGGEFRAPMAIAVIGGLIVSTVLSLVFVPSFYTVMDDLGRGVSWIFGRFIGPGEEAEKETQARAAETASLPLAEVAHIEAAVIQAEPEPPKRARLRRVAL